MCHPTQFFSSDAAMPTGYVMYPQLRGSWGDLLKVREYVFPELRAPLPVEGWIGLSPQSLLICWIGSLQGDRRNSTQEEGEQGRMRRMCFQHGDFILIPRNYCDLQARQGERDIKRHCCPLKAAMPLLFFQVWRENGNFVPSCLCSCHLSLVWKNQK